MNPDFLRQVERSTGFRAEQRGTPARARYLLLWATLATVALWFIPYGSLLLYPLRLFVTFVHEGGHALAATLTGGTVVSLSVHPSGSGLTQTMQSPLWAWLTLSGGYLGTAIFGGLLLQVGAMHRWKDASRAALQFGALLFLIAILFTVRDSFTLVVGLFFMLALWLAARLLPRGGRDFLVSFLAVQCCLNAILDLQILLHLTTSRLGDNDAVFMAQHYGLSPTFWALLWAGIAVIILFFSLRLYWRATERG
jgi:hypothetical protein